MPAQDELVEVEVEVAWLDTRPVRRPTPPVIDLTSLSDGPSSPDIPRAYPVPRLRPERDPNSNPPDENNHNHHRRSLAPVRRSPPRLNRTDSSTLGSGQAGRASPRVERRSRREASAARNSPVDLERLHDLPDRNDLSRLLRLRREREAVDRALNAFRPAADDYVDDGDDDNNINNHPRRGGAGAVIDLTDDNAILSPDPRPPRISFVEAFRIQEEARQASLARGLRRRGGSAGGVGADAGVGGANRDLPPGFAGWLPGLVAVNGMHHHFHHHHHHANNPNPNRNNRNHNAANNAVNNGNNNNNNARIAGAHLGARFFANDIPPDVMAFHQILNGGGAIDLAGAGAGGVAAGAGAGRDPQQPHSIDIPPAREGFTRDTGEDVVVVCPACERILEYDPSEEKKEEAAGSGGRRRSRKSQSEHHFWAVKACGHVFCRDCFESRRPTSKNKSLFRLPDGTPAANGAANSKVLCAVEDCSIDVTSKTAWVGIFL